MHGTKWGWITDSLGYYFVPCLPELVIFNYLVDLFCDFCRQLHLIGGVCQVSSHQRNRGNFAGQYSYVLHVSGLEYYIGYMKSSPMRWYWAHLGAGVWPGRTAWRSKRPQDLCCEKVWKLVLTETRGFILNSATWRLMTRPRLASMLQWDKHVLAWEAWVREVVG